MTEQIDDAVEFLKLNGHLEYGSVIPLDILERSIGVIKEDCQDGTWEWAGPFLALKQRIEEEGFFTSQRGVGDGLRILSLREMPEQLERVNDRIRRQQKRSINSMSNADFCQLDETDRARHQHALDVAVRASKALTSVLKELRF
jgi:hypothetical protein